MFLFPKDVLEEDADDSDDFIGSNNVQCLGDNFVTELDNNSNDACTLYQMSKNLLILSGQLNFWSSKFIVKEGDMCIDISSAACGSSSSVPIGAKQRDFPYTGTKYQFDTQFFHDCDGTNLDDYEKKIFAMLISSNTVDGCKITRRRTHKKVTCSRKITFTYACSHGRIMRDIDDSQFGPNSVGKLNVTHQHAKKHKSKGAIRGKMLHECILFFFKFIYLHLLTSCFDVSCKELTLWLQR